MIAVTGATGQLGHLVVENLIDRGVAPDRIVAVVRSPEKAADLATRGVEVRQADYTRPDSLPGALRGVEKLLLISSSEIGQRVSHHRNVVDAAAGAGVGLLAYTSVLNADTTTMKLAAEHQATEQIIRESGLPFVFLRNGWYLENYTGNLATILEQGTVLGCADDGRVSAATRADFAAAAAAVMAGGEHENTAYELGGDEAFTLAQLAEEISSQSGRAIEYRNLPEAAYVEVLLGAGLPETYARILADSDRSIARGELFTDSGDLHRLKGGTTTTMGEAVAAAMGG